MSRNKTYEKCNIPQTVKNIVAAICKDYYRRRRFIQSKVQAENEYLMQRYIELNTAIESALAKIEPGISKDILNDIIVGRGYQYSKAKCLSKDAYYRRRRKLIFDIAKSLSLL